MNETDDALEKGIRELQDAFVQDASFSIENWDESFQREFQKGLARWAEAEDSLIARRLDWELRAENKYIEAEKSWNEAFAIFSESRKAWVQEISLQIEEGRKIWNAKEDKFNEHFEGIALEIEKASVLQENKFSQQVQSAIELYRESLALLASSDESIKYYQGKINEISPDYGVLISQRAELEERRNLINATLADLNGQLAYHENVLASPTAPIADKYIASLTIPSLRQQISPLNMALPGINSEIYMLDRELAAKAGEIGTYSSEISTWQILKSSLEAQLTASKNMLFSLEAEAKGYDETVPVGTLENEIERVKGISEYLYNQWLISEVVVEYAQMNSSVRPTDAQTAVAYGNADQDLTDAEQIYQSAIAALTELRTKLGEGQISLAESRELMEEARAKMTASQQEYDTAFAIYQSKNPAVIEQMIKDLESELIIWFDGNDSQSPLRNELYLSYILASEYETRQTREEERQRVLCDINGQEEEGEPDSFNDISDLETRFESLKQLDPDLDTQNSGDWEFQLLGCGFQRDSEDFLGLTGLYESCFTGTDQNLSKLELQSLLNRYCDSAEANLLTARKSAAWLEKTALSEGESVDSIEGSLEEEYRQAENNLLYEKAALMQDILGGLESGEYAEEPWKEYADYLLLQELPDIPADGLDELIDILSDLCSGSLDREQAFASMDESASNWFFIVSGEKTLLPGQEFLDLYLNDGAFNDASSELAGWLKMKPYQSLVEDDFKRNTVLLGSETGNQFYDKLSSFSSLDDLLIWYRPLSVNDSVPEYFKTTVNTYISRHFGQVLGELDLDTGVLEEDLKLLEAQIDSFGFSESEILNSLRNEACFEVFSEAGFHQELQDWNNYNTLLEWKLYFREAEDQAWTEALAFAEENGEEVIEPELDKEVLFQSFLTDTSRSEISLAEIEEVDFSDQDLSWVGLYSDWSGVRVGDFIAENSPDAGYIESKFLKMMIEGSDRSLEGLWYEISRELYSEMLENLKQKSGEYNRIQLLQSIKELERHDDDIIRDQNFIKSMIVDCGRSMLSETSDAPLESSQSLWKKFENQQIISDSNSQKIIRLRADLEISRNDAEKYKTDVVDVLLGRYQSLQAGFNTLFEAYQDQIDIFDGIQQEYLAGQTSLNEACEVYQNAKYTHQKAGEILNFAQTGYSPETANVFAIRDERRKMYEKSVAALHVLQDIRDSGKNQAIVDARWQEYVDQSSLILSLDNNLGYAQEELVKELGELNRQYNATLGSLTKTAQDIVSFPGGFQFEPEMLNIAMTDFTSWGNGNLDGKFSSYVKDSKTYSKDVVQWMIMMGNSSSLLETFSYAYYNELHSMGKTWDQIKQEYGVDLLNHTYHSKLLDCDGDFFQSVHIGYEGDLNKYKAGGYETVERVFYDYFSDPPEISKVYISPEEWLKDRTQQYTDYIYSNSLLTYLYSFYKVLMFNGQFKDQSLKMGMSKDLSVMAWDYLRPKVKKERNKFKGWFGGYRGPGKNLNSWMKNIDPSVTSGIAKRNNVFSKIQSGKDNINSLAYIVQRRNTLTASDGLNMDSLQNIIRMVTGITLEADQKDLLIQSFGSLTDTETSSSIIALQALQKDLTQQKQISDQTVLLRENELRNDQQILYNQLMTEFSREDFDPDAYRTVANYLYENPAYLEEDYTAIRFGSIWAADDPSEQDSLYTMTAYGQQLVRSFQNRMDLVKQDRYTEMRKELEGIYTQRQFWEDRINELTNEGMEQWNLSTQRLIGQRERWRDDFERDYQYKTTLWEGKYKLLVRNKNTWIKNSSEAAVSSGTYAMARDMNLDAQSLIGEVNFSLIPDIRVETGDMNKIVRDSLDGTTVFKLLTGARSLTSRAGAHDVILSSFLPSVPDTTRAMDSLQEKQLALKEDISKALALAQAYQMKETVDKTRESILDNIDDANEGVDQSVESQLSSSGYARNGSLFTRDVVIDSSLLGGNENELQEIGAYEYFEAPSFDVAVNLDVNFMRNLDSSMIQASVKLAQERLYSYMNLIFGNEKEDKDIRTGLDESFIRYLESQEAAFKNSAQYNTGYEDSDEVWHDAGKHTDTAGLFYFHVGYAPEMDEDDPEEVDVKGYGEMGRIYEKFMIQQARLMRGLSTMTVPWYSQKIWDDDANNDGDSDSLIGAPSVRTVADIALSVAGTFVGCPFAGLMLSLIDDAIFTVADIGNGAMDADNAVLGFAKKAGVSLLSMGAGQMTAGLDKLATFEGYGSQFLEVSTDIANTGLNTAINNYGSSAINSITTDGFNLDGFNSMTSWDSIKMSYISGMAGTAVSSSLELGTFGFIGDAYKDSAKFTSMMGGLTSTGVQYAMAGEARLNVMNLGGTGVMELNLGGDGNLFNFGMGGTDVSLGAIRSAGRGLEAYSKNIEIKRNVEDKRLWAGMRTLYSTAEGSETKSLYNDVISGNTEFLIGTGQSYDGRTTADSGKRYVELNTDGKSRLDLAVLMSHEAYRDGYDNGAQGQDEETFKAAVGHMQVSSALQSIYGNRTLSSHNNDEADLFNKVVRGEISGNVLSKYVDKNYDSTGDFWKLMANGDMAKDDDGWLKNENGQYINNDGTLSDKPIPGKTIGAEGIETGLLNILNERGTSNKAYSDFSDAEIQAAQQLMINAGFTPSEVKNFKDRMWVDGNDGKTIKANSTLAGFGDTVATSVFMNGYDQVTDNVLFGNNEAVTLNTIMGLPETSRDRFISYLSAKENFWKGSHNIVSKNTLLQSSVTGTFGFDSYYPDGQHKGIDLATNKGENVLSYFGGKVSSNYSSDSAGNSLIINHGFNFENQFYSTGIQSQFMHMESLSTYQSGEYVPANTVIGQVGSTGQSTGPHLHWQLMGDYAGSSPESSKWGMYQSRRNQFLTQVSGLTSDKYTRRNTSDINYWAGFSIEDDYKYKNYYYNTNFMIENWGY